MSTKATCLPFKSSKGKKQTTTNILPTILVLGPKSSGKSSLIYSLKLGGFDQTSRPLTSEKFREILSKNLASISEENDNKIMQLSSSFETNISRHPIITKLLTSKLRDFEDVIADEGENFDNFQQYLVKFRQMFEYISRQNLSSEMTIHEENQSLTPCLNLLTMTHFLDQFLISKLSNTNTPQIFNFYEQFPSGLRMSGRQKTSYGLYEFDQGFSFDLPWIIGENYYHDFTNKSANDSGRQNSTRRSSSKIITSNDTDEPVWNFFHYAHTNLLIAGIVIVLKESEFMEKLEINRLYVKNVIFAEENIDTPIVIIINQDVFDDGSNKARLLKLPTDPNLIYDLLQIKDYFDGFTDFSTDLLHPSFFENFYNDATNHYSDWGSLSKRGKMAIESRGNVNVVFSNVLNFEGHKDRSWLKVLGHLKS